MNCHPSSSLEIDRAGTVLPIRPSPDVASRFATRASQVSRAESLQKTGGRMIFAGFAITIAGVVLYCAACFAGGMDAGMGDILLTNAAPFVRATLAVLGLGTLVWLIGSFTYLRGAMEIDEPVGEDRASIEKIEKIEK